MRTDQQNTQPLMALNPVGVVRSPFKAPMLMAKDSGLSLKSVPCPFSMPLVRS